jgi:hypothetical protein
MITCGTCAYWVASNGYCFIDEKDDHRACHRGCADYTSKTETQWDGGEDE